MEIKFTQDARTDLLYWQQNNKVKILQKIRQILESIIESPYKGIGKPEPLKHQYSGKWSRRIDQQHRIIYEVKENIVYVYSLRGHYK